MIRYGSLLVVLTGWLTLAGCLGPVGELYPPADTDSKRTIYVVQHSWHAGIVLASEHLSGDLRFLQDDFPGSTHFEFGWGDARYYPAADPGIGLLLRAALWPTPSVVHVAALDRPPRRYFPRTEVIEVTLSAKGYGRLVEYLVSEFKEDPEAVASGLYGPSNFYAGHRYYHVFHNCNHWVARALRRAGCPITPLYALTVDNLMGQVRSFGRPLPAPNGLQR